MLAPPGPKGCYRPKLVQMTACADMDDQLGPELGTRLAKELGAALRRRPAQELRLAGAIRLLVSSCERLREAAAAGLDLLVRRNSLDRPLFGACIRGLAECGDPRIVPVVKKALALEEGGGLLTLAAAAFVDAPELGEHLARLAASRSPHTAFAAEAARLARGESDGSLLVSIAPRIKESHRIDLCNQFILPLVWSKRSLPGMDGGLAVLRDTERHLGRWLLLAELGQRAGDQQPLAEAKERVGQGSPGARAAWHLVTWALDSTQEIPDIRPTLELVARLSDRPSAERDVAFLFRMAAAGLVSTRPMLESLLKSPVLSTELSTRAAGFLLRDHGRDDLERRLVELAKSAGREHLRGLAVAVLRDARPSALSQVPADFSRSRQVHNAAWSALTRLAEAEGRSSPVVDEPTYRRVQLGWLD